jgi:4a-hydroxytetrahydrobiopterin dehydratase
MNLSERKCAACRGDTPTLSTEEIANHLAQVSDWKVKESSIERTFSFNNFKEALAFFNKVAVVAEEEDHHPDMGIMQWRENDFIMAAKINALG